MVIRMTGAYNFGIDDLEVYANQMDDMNIEIINEVRDEIAPLLLDELATEPAPAKKPIDWTSKKQMRYYFAVVAKRDGNGNIIPYKRTGKLARGWTVVVRGSAIVIENLSDIAKFVVGSLAQNRVAALRFQQRFHANTGWQPATDTVKFWLEAANELYLKKFDDRLSDFAKSKPTRRAYTKGTRRR